MLVIVTDRQQIAASVLDDLDVCFFQNLLAKLLTEVVGLEPPSPNTSTS
jgi:hypothetical protein